MAHTLDCRLVPQNCDRNCAPAVQHCHWAPRLQRHLRPCPGPLLLPPPPFAPPHPLIPSPPDLMDLLRTCYGAVVDLLGGVWMYHEPGAPVCNWHTECYWYFGASLLFSTLVFVWETYLSLRQHAKFSLPDPPQKLLDIVATIDAENAQRKAPAAPEASGAEGGSPDAPTELLPEIRKKFSSSQVRGCRWCRGGRGVLVPFSWVARAADLHSVWMCKKTGSKCVFCSVTMRFFGQNGSKWVSNPFFDQNGQQIRSFDRNGPQIIFLSKASPKSNFWSKCVPNPFSRQHWSEIRLLATTGPNRTVVESNVCREPPPTRGGPPPFVHPPLLVMPNMFPVQPRAATTASARKPVDKQQGSYRAATVQEIAQMQSVGWVIAYTEGSAKTVRGGGGAGYGVFFEDRSSRNHAAHVSEGERRGGAAGARGNDYWW